MKLQLFALPIVAAVFTASTLTTKAALIVTYAESPTSVNSTLSGTSVFDFNTTSLGRSTNVSWSGVGTFDQLYVLNADQYGGAADATHPNGTRYAVEGVGTPVSTTDLHLSHASSYFGMYWSAGDAANVLDFYSGTTLVGEFTTASLLSSLPTSYDGNPINRTMDSSEPFAFINFFADQNTTWDSIVLHNNASSGFEADNFTTRTTAWNPMTDGALPGVPVALVDGTTTTKVTKESISNTRWAQTASSMRAAPGAPAPPLSLLSVFGLIAVARGRAKSKKQA